MLGIIKPWQVLGGRGEQKNQPKGDLRTVRRVIITLVVGGTLPFFSLLTINTIITF